MCSRNIHIIQNSLQLLHGLSHSDNYISEDYASHINCVVVVYSELFWLILCSKISKRLTQSSMLFAGLKVSSVVILPLTAAEVDVPHMECAPNMEESIFDWSSVVVTIYMCKSILKVPLTFNKVMKIKHEKFYFVNFFRFLSSSTFFTRHNSKGIWSL